MPFPLPDRPLPRPGFATRFVTVAALLAFAAQALAGRLF